MMMTDRKITVTDPDLNDIFAWFDSWLGYPLSDRERIVIRETWHVIQNPESLERSPTGKWIKEIQDARTAVR